MADRPAPPPSHRARRLVDDSAIAAYIAEHQARRAAADDGYLSLAIAENVLMWDLIDRHANAARDVPASAFAYDDMRGARGFREAIAGLLRDRLYARPVNPDHVVTMAGAGAIVESLMWVLGDPGTGVLIPTPSYAGYWTDIETRTDLVAIPAATTPDDDFRISPAVLDAAAADATVPIGVVLLTNPSNPLGRVLTDDEVLATVAWARSHGIPTVVNEIYGLSTFGDTAFRSATELLGGFHPDVHHVWGFSKDFAASGLRAGVCVSVHDGVLGPMGDLAYFASVSGDTQHLLTAMITDRTWVDAYLDELRRRLATSHARASQILGGAGIPTIDADAGVFLLADLRGFLDEVSWDAEDRLWRRILDTTGVNLTPGSACRIAVPGFMRVCHASAPHDAMSEGLEAVATLLTR